MKKKIMKESIFDLLQKQKGISIKKHSKRVTKLKDAA